MSAILDKLRTLSTAEDFFTTLDVAFDPHVVNVNRLHILKRFQQHMRTAGIDSLAEAEQKDACAQALKKAHDDFVVSSGVQEKVFKVFQDPEAAPAFVSLDTLKTRRS